MLMSMFCCFDLFFFFKQKTAYEMRISDWSSDVCSSDLEPRWECLRINMWCAAGSSGRNICLATRRSPSRRLPMAADFRTRSICPACSAVMSGRHRRRIGDASTGRPRDEVIGPLYLKGLKSDSELRQATDDRQSDAKGKSGS